MRRNAALSFFSSKTFFSNSSFAFLASVSFFFWASLCSGDKGKTANSDHINKRDRLIQRLVVTLLFLCELWLVAFHLVQERIKERHACSNSYMFDFGFNQSIKLKNREVYFKTQTPLSQSTWRCSLRVSHCLLFVLQLLRRSLPRRHATLRAPR